MIGPQRRPQEFGFSDGDTHLVVNDEIETVKAFDRHGYKLFEMPCLARGQFGEADWRRYAGDTPPGLYKLGQMWADYEIEPMGFWSRDRAAYGWYTWDMVDLEGNEDNNGRAGICLHGGGSAAGWPGAWNAHQLLLPTLGCLRMYNSDLRDHILPRYKLGTVFVSVYQES